MSLFPKKKVEYPFNELLFKLVAQIIGRHLFCPNVKRNLE